MKSKKFIIILQTVLVFGCTAQNAKFEEFKGLFQEKELPFAVDSCSVHDLVYEEEKRPKISKKMKDFIPAEIYDYLFKYQRVKAFYRFPISDSFVSLMFFGCNYEDGFDPIEGDFYLVNYDCDGKIIEYISLGRYTFEVGHSWFTIDGNNIYQSSYEHCVAPPSYKFDYVTLPLQESKSHYEIDESGHFTKELLYLRKGIYKFSDNNCVFIFYKEFPKDNNGVSAPGYSILVPLNKPTFSHEIIEFLNHKLPER